MPSRTAPSYSLWSEPIEAPDTISPAIWQPYDEDLFWDDHCVKNQVSGFASAMLLSATVLSATLLLLACSGIARRQDDQSQFDRNMRYAGAPIDHFTYLGRYDSWLLSRNQLLVWTSPNDAYLLTVADFCNDLQFVQRIGLSSTGGSVSRLEAITFDHQRCPINEIRPVDYRQMRRDAARNSDAPTDTK
jgi:hypothetical protein